MADLPPDRLDPAPPFTNVGLDIFSDIKVKLGKATLTIVVLKRKSGLCTSPVFPVKNTLSFPWHQG